MDRFLYDLRSGFRILTKSPGPAAVAVLVLTLGVGATVAMFSIVDGTVLKGLPYEEPAALMHVENHNLAAGIESRSVTAYDFLDYRRAQSSFEELSAFYETGINLSGEEDAVRVGAARISASAFRQLRVRAALGRGFADADEQVGGPEIILLGHHVWRDRYASDPDVVGKSILVDGEAATVVGVMPEGFRFPVTEDAWLPLRLDLSQRERDDFFLEVFGRLRDGTSLDEAKMDLAMIAQRLADDYPDSNQGVGVLVKPFVEEYVSEEKKMGLTALGAVFFVLLIACSNVANLLLARTAGRTKEIALRTALGAGRGRIVGQVLAESFCLALVAAPLGLVVAYYTVEIFNAATADQDWPFWFDVAINEKAVAFVFVLTAVTALLSGLMPALRASRLDTQAILKDETRGGGLLIGKLARGLVVAEVAMSCILLVGAGLMVRSIVNLADIDFAFDEEGLFTARVGVVDSSYPEDGDKVRFFERLAAGVSGLPGVESAALTNGLPGSGWTPLYYYGVGEKAYASDEEYPWAHVGAVTPGFFKTLGVEVDGRGFSLHDSAEGEAVVIVNRSFAEREWPGADPLGRRVRVGRSDSERPWMRVVGIVPDLHMGGIKNRFPAGMYRPMPQHPVTFMAVLARTQSDPTALTAAVRGAVRDLDRGLALFQTQTLAAAIDQQKFFYRLMASIYSTMGAVAVLLAAVGMYGVLAFSVRRRTTEIGVRMALGARARDVLGLVVGQGLRQVALGIVLGLAMAAGVAHLMSSQLFGIGALDPVTFVAIAAVLVAVGAVAALVPAERASRVSPTEALRYE